MDPQLQFSYQGMALTMMLVAASLAVGVGFKPSGMRTWNAAVIWQTVGWCVLAASPLHPSTLWLTTALGAGAVVAAPSFMTLSAAHYLGRRLSTWWTCAPAAAVVVLELATLQLEDLHDALPSLVMGFQLAWLTWLLLPKKFADLTVRWRWLAAFGFAIATLLSLLPPTLFLVAPAHTLPHPNAQWKDVFTVAANGWPTIAVMCTLAFLLAHRDEAERALQRLATRDGLTGLLNRRSFMEQGEARVAQRLRQHKPVTVVILDLDHFKQINDTRGHPVGDKVIALFSELLSENVLGVDLAGRYGGEEFCLVLDADDCGALAIDRRLREQLAERAPASVGFRFDFSAGAAVCTPGGETLAELIGRADDALYSAKHTGRGQMVVAAPLARHVDAARPQIAAAL